MLCDDAIALPISQHDRGGMPVSGARLTLARQLRGMTQTQLADAVHIGQRAISKYEMTGQGLGPETLAAIAKVLQFDVSFFDGPDMEVPTVGAISFRARSKMSARKRDQAIASSAFGVALSDWMDSEYVLPSPSVPDFSGYEPEDAAEALRAEWGLGEGPIADIVAIMEAHGVRVFSVTEASQEVDAYSFWDEARNKPFVFLTTSKSGERRRMDAAHELGHLVLHRKVELQGKETRAIESQADSFGSAFLMPRRGFRASISRNMSLSEVMRTKKIWKVSAFATVYRAHTLGMLSDWQYHNLCVTMSRRGMRTNEPDGMIPERSEVDDKVLELAKEDYGSTFAVSKATGIPYDLVMGLTFNPPINVISGAGNSSDNHESHGEMIRNFRIIENPANAKRG